MALLFMDGFEEYSGSLLASGNPANPPYWSYDLSNRSSFSTVARTAQNGITARSLTIAGNGGLVYLSIPPSTGTLIMGFNWRPTEFSTRFCGFTSNTSHAYNSNPTNGIRLAMNGTGQISVVNNSNSAVLGTLSGTYPLNAWYHVAIKYEFSTGTTGSIEVKMDDVSVLNLTGINTSCGATAISAAYLQSSSFTTQSVFFDDFYLCDGTGTTNNTFLGPVGVYTLIPNGAGSLTQMTPSAGSNFQCVDEMGYTTTDWVTSTASGQTDLYTMSDLPVTPAAIAGVMVKARSQKATTNNSGLQLGIKSGANTEFSATRQVLTSLWQDNYNIFETQPGGGSWTEATVNAMETGIKGV